MYNQITDQNILENAPALPTDKQTTAQQSTDWICPEFKVSGVFSSHMVLQREQPIKIWGFSNVLGSQVTGSFMGEMATTTVEENNRWTLTFSARPCEKNPQQMTITDDHDHTVIFEDVLIGDVWLLGGQSNAELNLEPCMYLTPDIEFHEEDNFRLFAQTQDYPYTHQEFCAAPQPDVINPEWCWKHPDKESSLMFSAIGWYFAKEITQCIDVPLGLIMMAAGGSCIRELIPVEIAHQEGYTYGALVQEGGYFNTLIHPFIGLPFKAMIFFQGESEGGTRKFADRYAYELALLVSDERARFGQNFPFYNIQLSDYREEGEQYFPWLDTIRVQQFKALSTIPNSTLTVDMDLGSPAGYPDFAHSPFKKELSDRLAKLALAREYGVGQEAENSSPYPVIAFFSEDGKHIIVEFKNVSSGLAVRNYTSEESYGMEVKGFSVGDYDHRVITHAVITDQNTVTVDIPSEVLTAACESSESIEMLMGYVSYAYIIHITPDNANLCGGNMLPVPAFSLPVTTSV